MDINRSLLTAVLLAAGSLAACAPHPYAYSYGYGYSVPPPPAPPAYAGVYGVAPGQGYVWTDGFYDLRGGNWVWVGGRWTHPPRTHAVWVTPHWVRTGHGWSRRGGYWR
jgi:hypothetical protein